MTEIFAGKGDDTVSGGGGNDTISRDKVSIGIAGGEWR